jgi:anthranilate phosphoribosyltransferase
LRGGTVTTGSIDPAALGLPLGTVLDIQSGDPQANAATARSIVAGEQGARRTAVLLNAGAALLVGAVAESLREGTLLAAAAIDTGAAASTLERFVATSQRLGAGASGPA